MKPIAGAVILYYPDKNEIVKNLSSYNSYLDKVFIIDNSPGADCEKLFGAFENVTYIKNQKNLGIAAALNTAISQALENTYFTSALKRLVSTVRFCPSAPHSAYLEIVLRRKVAPERNFQELKRSL